MSRTIQKQEVCPKCEMGTDRILDCPRCGTAGCAESCNPDGLKAICAACKDEEETT